MMTSRPVHSVLLQVAQFTPIKVGSNLNIGSLLFKEKKKRNWWRNPFILLGFILFPVVKFSEY
jgi:hypothetical protein